MNFLYIFLIVSLVVVIFVYFLFRRQTGKPVNKRLSNQFYLKKNKIYFVPTGNWFELGMLEIEAADPVSFTVLSDSLAKDRNKVYFEMLEIDDADPSSVSYLWSNYYRDDHRLYYRQKLLGSYQESNEIVRFEDDRCSPYVRLADKIFYYGEKLDIAFPDKFRILQQGYTTDGSNIYYKEKKVSGIDIDTCRFIKVAEPSKELDLPASFLADYKHVFWRDKLIVGADPASFYLIDNIRWYFSDKDSVFYYKDRFSDNGHIVKAEGMSPDTFKVLDDYYERDDKFLYAMLRKLPNSDPDSYKRINDSLSVDSNNLYWNGKVVLNMAPEQANLLMRGYSPYHYDDVTVKLYDETKLRILAQGYHTDGSDIFCWGSYIADADLKSFRVINSEFSQDVKHVFYFTNKLIDADVNTFEVIDGNFSKDRQSVYWQQYRLIDVNPEGFSPQADSYGTAIDDTTARYTVAQ